jgi:cell division protease FtsH
MVDKEIRRIIDEQYGLARKIIEDNRDKVEMMAKALLEWETIDSDQINDIMEGREPRPPADRTGGGYTDDGASGEESGSKEAKPNLDMPAGEH